MPVIVVMMMATMRVRVRVMFGNVGIVFKVKRRHDGALKAYWAQQPIGRFGA